jgi:hypothetical protein
MKRITFIKNLFLITTVIIISSCFRKEKSITNEDKQSNDAIIKTSFVKPKLAENKQHSIDTVILNFDYYKLLLIDFYVYDVDSFPKKDTLNIYPELGSDFDSQKFIINLSSNIKSIEIFENFRSVLTISNEGPHLDLYNWKGYESSWFPVKVINQKEFSLKEITIEEGRQFPEFTKEELITLADKEDKSWGNLIRKPYNGNWKDSYAIGVGLRRLKIITINNKGEKKTQYLIAYIPMGC